MIDVIRLTRSQMYFLLPLRGSCMRHPEGSVGDGRPGVHLLAVSWFLAPRAPFAWMSSFALASSISFWSGISYGLQGGATVVAEEVLLSVSRVADITFRQSPGDGLENDLTHMRQPSKTKLERLWNYGYRCLTEGLRTPPTQNLLFCPHP